MTLCKKPLSTLWAAPGGRVSPSPAPPLATQADISGEERLAQGIYFSGRLSFILHIFYPPFGTDFLKHFKIVMSQNTFPQIIPNQ